MGSYQPRAVSAPEIGPIWTNTVGLARVPPPPSALPRRQFLAKTAAFLALAPGTTATQPTPAWLWSGAVTATSATVLASFERLAGSVPPLLVSERRDLGDARAVEGRAVPAPALSHPGRVVVEYVLANLTSNSEYFGGFRAGSGTLVRFRTFGAGPFSFTAAFASCAGGTRIVPLSHVSNSRVFDAIAALDPHVFIHMGDFHYYNITGPARPVEPLMGRFRLALDRVLSQEHQALFYRRTPIVYMWDDHDYGQNDSDARSPTRDAARAYYATDVPHYPLPIGANADGPIAQVFDIGRVRFLVTDSRSGRLPAERTMLGLRQFKWLLDELGRAAADRVPLVVWVNPVPWIAPDSDGHGWGAFAQERQAIGDRITSLELGSRLLMLSGDGHMLAFDDGRNNVNGGFVVAHAAPLDRFVRPKGGPYSHEPPQQKNGQFATLRIEDTGAAITATLQGHRHTGNGRSTPLPEARLQVRCHGLRGELVPVS